MRAGCSPEGFADAARAGMPAETQSTRRRAVASFAAAAVTMLKSDAAQAKKALHMEGNNDSGGAIAAALSVEEAALQVSDAIFAPFERPEPGTFEPQAATRSASISRRVERQ